MRNLVGAGNLRTASRVASKAFWPLAIADGALLASEFVVEPLVRGALDSTVYAERNFQREKARRAARDRFQEMNRQKLQELQLQMTRNAQRLASADPQLTTEVMAGRRLPQGAVVIGGQPRVDLLQELAMQMSRGDFDEFASDGTSSEALDLMGF